MAAVKFSADWIREQLDPMNTNTLLHHDCSICGVWTKYVFYPDGTVLYVSSCGCSWSTPRQSSVEDVAGWLAMQSSDEIREKIWSKFS